MTIIDTRTSKGNVLSHKANVFNEVVGRFLWNRLTGENAMLVGIKKNNVIYYGGPTEVAHTPNTVHTKMDEQGKAWFNVL